MKALNRIIFLSLVLMMVGFVGYAQSSSAFIQQNRKELKLKKKEARAKAAQESRKYYANLLKNKAFIMEATQLYGPAGNMFVVSPTTNFFAVRKNKIIFQYGLGFGGRNGLGGMTAEGFITHYKFNQEPSKNKALSVSGQIKPKGSGMPGYFNITVNNNGNGYLTITFPVGGTLSMSGRVVALPEGNVFKGTSDF